MKNTKGFTLIELVVTVALLVIVLTGGTAIFFRSFRSSGVSDVQALVNNSLRSLDEMIERSLRYGMVYRVSGVNGVKVRKDCLMAGDNGVVGNTLVVIDNVGGTAAYTLDENGKVSSNSGIVISNAGIKVSKLQFTWYCRSGVNDKMNLYIEASSSAKTGEGSTGVFNKDINLLNSGIN